MLVYGIKVPRNICGLKIDEYNGVSRNFIIYTGYYCAFLRKKVMEVITGCICSSDSLYKSTQNL